LDRELIVKFYLATVRRHTRINTRVRQDGAFPVRYSRSRGGKLSPVHVSLQGTQGPQR